jgi:hypothetical protein
MSENVIKFGKAKKAIARQKHEKSATENRIKFGRTKSEKQRDKLVTEKQIRSVDDHKKEQP